jgi:sugar phosphate isomerase/epimerase
MDTRISRRTALRGAVAGAAAVSVLGKSVLAMAGAAAPKPTDKGIWPFYAFDNGVRTVPTVEGKVKLLKDLGYVGIECQMNHKGLPGMLEALDKHGLTLNAVYSVPFVEDPADPGLPESVKRMKGRATRIELAIRSRTFKKPSDPAGDEKGADLLKHVSDLCADTGPVVSVYPHTGFWTEKVEDGVRLARRIGRGNVGTNFNLVHWQWVKQGRPLEAVLKEAAPHLMSVTINNGQRDKRTITSLEEGDYDLVGFMRLLKKVGYTGQVGLQCWSIKEKSELHLARSMERWREIVKEVAGAA